MTLPPDPTRTPPTRPGRSGESALGDTGLFWLVVAITFAVGIFGVMLYSALTRDRSDWELIREPSTGRTFQCHRYQDDLCVEVFP